MKSNGWKVDSWTDLAPLPPERPFSDIARYTRWKEFDFYAVPNEQEKQMADTVRANWAVDFLKRDHDKPFFLAFGTYAPHKPNYAPQKYFDLYPLEQIELPPIQENDLDDLPEEIQRKLNGRAKRVHNLIEEHGDWKRAIQGYMACISYADAMLGRVLDALEQSPYAENTVVVLWSDNGYHLGEKTWWAKHTLWQRTSHVPFIWAGPGIPRGAKPDCTVSLIDTCKTLIDLCGLSQQKELDGKSLVSVFQGLETDMDRTVVVAESRESFAVINRNWRLIVRPEGNELYNRRNDPNEWKNLAGNPEYADVEKTLLNQLPSNPAEQAMGRKNRKLKLVLDGEDYRWVPTGK